MIGGHYTYAEVPLFDYLKPILGFERNNYDKLGRITKTYEPEGTSTLTYDIGNKAKGKLSSLSSTTGYSEAYVYDGSSRLSSTVTTLPSGGGTYEINTFYNVYSQVQTQTYPSGFVVKNDYNSYGYLSKVKRLIDGFAYFTANSATALAQMKTFTLGNGRSTTRTYNPLSLVTAINTGSGSVQNLTYTYNTVNNLIQRKDFRRSRYENLTFDVLNRLKTSTVKNFSNVTQSSLIMDYNANGNIYNKSDLGCYHYGVGNAGVHAVTSIDNYGTFTYDNNGNILNSPTYTASGYTSFNKPTTITKGGNTLTFSYGPGHGRYKQVVSGTNARTVYYVGGLYEKVVYSGYTHEKHYINAAGSVIAVYNKKSNAIDETRYLHKDHLGSITEITNEGGGIVESFSYDAWGKRRNPTLWTAGSGYTPFYDRGFTNHEHLDEVGVIHMNGRVYDPTIARFMSADPVIQAPDNTQSMNRYSYVMNAPPAFLRTTPFLKTSMSLKRAIIRRYGANRS